MSKIKRIVKAGGFLALIAFSLLSLVFLFAGNLGAQEDAVLNSLEFNAISQAPSTVAPVIEADNPADPLDTGIFEALRENIKEARSAANEAKNLSAAGGADQTSKTSGPQKGITSTLRERMKNDIDVRFRPVAGTPCQIKVRREAKGRGAVLGKALSGFVPGREQDEETARDFLYAYRGMLRISNPDNELRLSRYKKDQLGRRHLRYTQEYRGLPVWPAELNVHLDPEGNVDLMNGAFVSTPRKLVTQPVLDAEDAIERARKEVPDGERASAKAPSMIVYAPGDRASRLAWKMELSISVASNWLVVIDALNGATLTVLNQVKTENVSGAGLDLFGITRQLNVWQADSTYYMVDASKPMHDPAYDTLVLNQNQTQGTIMIQDLANTEPEDNQADHITSQSSTSGWLEDGVSLAYGLSETYDYYLDRHNRNSFDGNGGRILGFVRLGGKYNDNAYWNGGLRLMAFGDARPYAGALDVVAHELTHGVTDYTSNLLYQNQSGALNESFSDIFGEMVEARTDGSTDWIHGTVLNEEGSRNLKDPSSVEIEPGEGYYYPSTMNMFYRRDELPLTWYADQDYGGVHINCTIVAHAFYLLAEGLDGAIGLQDAANIFYRAQTVHLLSNSQFVDARLACISSAEELFGLNSTQVIKTADAFDAVEIFDGGPTPEPTPVEPVSGPDSAVYISRDNSGYYLHLYEEGEEYYLTENEVSPSRASVTGDGNLALFVDAQNDACFIPTNCSFCEECLGLPGEIGSVAMSPDGQVYGVVLLDEDGDPYNEIGIIDFQEDVEDDIRVFQLVSPAIDGVSTNTIRYADAMDFTSDNRYLIYDAFNVLQFEDGTEIGTWSIYAIDLETEQTITLTTPATDFDMGYPALSQTTDHFITFDALSADTGESIVYAMNLITGESVGVGIVPNGWGVPVYNGDDTAIVYSYPDDSPTGYYLKKQRLADDRISPYWSASKAFDLISGGAFGVIFRRGVYTAPEQNISVSPATMSFGETSLGDTVNASLTVSNIGTANLEIDDYYLTGSNSSEFNIVSGICIGGTLVPSGTCIVTVAFSPTSQGEKTATLSVESDDPDTPVFDIQINGEAIDDTPIPPEWVTMNGSVSTENGTPLCAMVLANGQHMFTCGADLGLYELEVPLDSNGMITLYGFCSGFAPFQAILTPEEALNFDITMSRVAAGSREIETTLQTEPGTTNQNYSRIIGTVTYGGTPLCAMILANGQRMFSCGDDIGTFDLEVPLDGNGEITLYVFCSGFAPYKQVFMP